jgi:hypothetical protein
MSIRGCGLVLAFAFIGCGDSSPRAKPANSMLMSGGQDAAIVEAALKVHAVAGHVVGMRDYGEYWHVTVSSADGETKLPDGSITITSPDSFKVFKDGRVSNARDDRPIAGK